MNSQKVVLTAAFSLIMSAFTAPAADITITSLPYSISVPGTYILKSNMSVNGVFAAGITVDSAVAGPIIIDLKGLMISGLNNPGGALIYISDNPTASRITIRNGRLQGGPSGSIYGVDVNRTLSRETVTNWVSNIHIKGIIFDNLLTGVLFQQTNSSSVTDCAFTAAPRSAVIGINSIYSQGGNHYKNDSFDGNQSQQLLVVGPDGFPNFAAPVVLKDCRYEAPAKGSSNAELEDTNE
jgi:hypothetical protein